MHKTRLPLASPSEPIMKLAFSTALILTVIASTAFGQEPITVEKCRLTLRDRIEITGLETGRISEIHVAQGTVVAQGDPILKLDDTQLRMSLAIADKQVENRLELLFAEKAKQLAEQEHEIAASLNREIPGARSQLELQGLRLKMEHAQLQSAQAVHANELAAMKREQLRLNLQECTIRSPMNGTVVEMLKHPGEVVRAGEKIAVIVNTSELLVEGYLPVQHAWSVEPNSRLFARPAHDDLSAPGTQQTIYRGSVLMLDPEIDEISRTVRFVGVLANHDQKLKAGMTMIVQLETGTPRTAKR